LPASEIALHLRIGTRTLFTLRRRLVRHGVSLADSLGGRPIALPPLAEDDDGYRINGLPAAALPPLIAAHPRLKPFIRQHYARRYARLDQDFDSYLAGFSAKSRSTAKRKLKRFAERSGGRIDVRCHRTEAEIESFYVQARQVSSKTYQERQLDAGLPAGEEALAAMRSLARADRARGWLLHLDACPIAYLWTPAQGETLLYAYLGYDPDHLELSPGTVLQLEAMRAMMAERRFRLFDFTEGDSQQKRLLASGEIDCVDLLLVRRRAGALAAGYALAAFDGAVAVAKRLLRRRAG
jgi:CelD/BcsL family acetyltransferase involved in cellulose biosynthesis